MTEPFLSSLASRRMSRRSIVFSLALTAVGSAIVSCSGASTGPVSRDGKTAPSAGGVTTAPNVVPASGGPAVNVVTAANVTPVNGGSSASVRPTPPTNATPTAAAPAVASSTIIKMNDQFKFDPDTVTIPKGTTVEWQNAGTQPHTVTCDPAKAMDKSHVSFPSGATPFDSGLIDAGKSYKTTFTVPGEYRYICIPHEAMGMIGTIKVI